MHKKDYLQRRLEEFGKVLALILTLKKDGDWDRFEKEIAEAGKTFTDLEIEQVEQMSHARFAAEVLQKPGLDLEQKKILAALLFEKLSYYAEKNDQALYQSTSQLCRELYQHIRNNLTDNEFDLDVHYKLQLLGKMS